MNNKKRILLTSAITIATCLALITGSTFALFTDGDNVINVAITAGDFDITATPVDTNGDGVDFTVGTELSGKLPVGSASFSSTTNEISLVKMVPGDYVTFSIIVENKGNIAADCTVKFEQKTLSATADIPAEKVNKLWDALKVTVKKDGTTVIDNQPISSAFPTTEAVMVLNPKDNEDNLPYTSVYEITIKFPSSDTNGSIDNAYINTSCAFTYSVYAEQHNDEITNP